METLLEELMVRLGGDASGYFKELQKAQAATADAAKAIEGQGKKIEGFGSLLMKGLGYLGFAAGLKVSLDAFVAFERGAIRLRAAIENNGRAASAVIPQYMKFATEMERTTLMTKGQVMGLFQQAEMMGKTGAQAEQLVRTSIALAGATGDSAESFLAAVNAMEQGNLQMIKRRIASLRFEKDEFKVRERINAMISGGMRVHQEEANSLGGRMEKLGRSLKSLTMDIGGIVASAVGPVVDWVKQAVDWFKSLDPTIRQTVAQVLLLVVAIKPMSAALGVAVGAVQSLGAAFAVGSLSLGGWVAVLAGVAVVAYRVTQSLTGMNAAMERSNQLQQQALDWDRQNTQATMTRINAIQDRSERERAVRRELARARQEEEGRRATVNSWIAQRNTSARGSIETAWYDEQIAQARQRYDQARDLTGQLQNALNSFSTAGPRAELDKLIEKLQTDLANVGLSELEQTLARLEGRGLGRSATDVARRLQQQKELKEMATELNRTMRSPQTAFREEQEKLNEALRRNYITQEIYNRALKDARERILGVKQATVELNSVRAGSLEDLIAQEKYVEMLQGGPRRGDQINSSVAGVRTPAMPEATGPSLLTRALTELFGQVRDRITEMARRPGVVIEAANLGEG